MSISKNFVVKNGFEASTNLIVADADTRRVGVGTTAPEYTLHVNGGIGATDFYLSGIGTFANELNVGLDGSVLTVLGIGNSIGVGTALPAFLLDIRSPVSTGQTALYVQGDIEVTGDIRADDVVFDDAQIQDLTVTDTFIVAGLSTFNSNVFINAALNVVGLSTLGGYVDINNSVDISNDLNVVGLSTLGGYVDINNSVDISNDLNVVGLSTLGGYVDINNSVDISNDLNVVGVTTLATVDINAGEIDVTRIETSNLNVTGIATIATISVVGAALSSLIVSGISTLAIVDINGGDIDVTRIETGSLSVTGISTLGNVEINAGIITATSGIVTYFGDGSNLTGLPGVSTLQSVLSVGNTSTIGMLIVGVVTATEFVGDGSGLTGVGIGSTGSINTTGIITATSFFGDGSGLSGVSAGSTVFNDTTTNQEFFPLFTDITTGTVTASGISTSKLTYNPFNGEVTAVDFNSTSDVNLKTNIHTVENALETVNSLRGVSFDWKETGKSSYGVIAQELQEVLPDLVKNAEVKSVNYNGIIGVLIEAIKELKAEVEELKNSK